MNQIPLSISHLKPPLYKSSNLVIFVNYEDFLHEIGILETKKIANNTTIFAGYDCDSMAYDNVTNFSESLLTKFSTLNNIELELRTKSIYTKPLIKKSFKNVVLAFSFTPNRFSSKYEIGVANIKNRIKALKSLINVGWKIGVRLDPFVIYRGWEKEYIDLFELLFTTIPSEQLHSVTYGNIRFPKDIFMNIKKLHINEKLFYKFHRYKYNIYDENNGEVIKSFCESNLLNYVHKNKIYCNIHEK